MGSALSNAASEAALSPEAISRQKTKKAGVSSRHEKEHPKRSGRLPSRRFTSDDPHSSEEQARPCHGSSKLSLSHRRRACRSEETKILADRESALKDHRDVLKEASEIILIRSAMVELHDGDTIDDDAAAAPGFHGIIHAVEQLQPRLVTRNVIDDPAYNDETTTFTLNEKQRKMSLLLALSSLSITSDNAPAVDNNDSAVESSCNTRRLLVAIKCNRPSKFGEPACCPSIKKTSSSRAASTILAPSRRRYHHQQQHKTPSPQSQPSRPHVFISNNCKVTMLDERKKVFVIDLISKETCHHIRALTEDHLMRTKLCGANVETWRTLYTYTKMDMPCNEVQSLASISNQIMRDIILIIGHVFGKPKAASKLKPRSSKEPHLLLYQKVNDKEEHTGVEMHYDGCAVTFNLMLSDLDEYTGGGTYMRAMRTTVKLRIGQCLVHPGELYHCGVDIGSGTRFLIVGFLDGFDPKIFDESTEKNDLKEYHRNVVTV